MYLTFEEIESTLAMLATNHPTAIQRFALPNNTAQSRTSHAVKIANGSGAGRIGVFFVAGVHGNEWVPPETLLNFIDVLSTAFQNGTGVTLGSNIFTVAQIQFIVSTLDIFVFPLANPDGRERSQTSLLGMDTEGRKNRNPDGWVDINRNFDYLWDYPIYFSPDVIPDDTGSTPTRPIANSKDEESSVYIGAGTGEDSEAETKNIVHIVDANPNIRFFIDLHAAGRKIFINWGNDEIQTTDVNMNFRNPVYDGQRGVFGDSYKEYVSPSDNALRNSLAGFMRDAIQNVHGNSYSIEAPFDGITVAGTSADYMNSRNYVNPSLQKVHGFGMEIGTGGVQPSLSIRDETIEEVTAGLIRFCLEVTALPSDVFIRDNLVDSGEEPLVSGGISRSPDINHYRQELVDPMGILGTAMAKNRGDLFETIEIGQPNFIYVRLQNRGYQTDDAEVDIYWMPPSTLPSPASWNHIGTISVDNVQPGEFKIGEPLEWNSIPDKGHYCFVGVIGTTTKPKPDINTITTIDDFYNLVRQSNNVTWKNFDVDDMFIGGMTMMSFRMQGWRRIPIQTDLEVDLSELPRATKVDLRILKRLTGNTVLKNMMITKTTKLYNHYEVSSGRLAIIRGLQLRSSDNVQAILKIHLAEDTIEGSYDIAVIQKVEGREMGRITRRLNVGQFPFIANRRSGELHKKNCPWIPKMSSVNKVPYNDVQRALNHGYDGCYTCLNEHNQG